MSLQQPGKPYSVEYVILLFINNWLAAQRGWTKPVTKSITISGICDIYSKFRVEEDNLYTISDIPFNICIIWWEWIYNHKSGRGISSNTLRSKIKSCEIKNNWGDKTFHQTLWGPQIKSCEIKKNNWGNK